MSTTTKTKQYAAITSDVVESRKVKNFPLLRDQKLRHASQLHLQQKLVLQPYTVTTWDEFQNIVPDLREVPRVILDLRRWFRPLGLRIAVGIGSVVQPRR